MAKKQVIPEEVVPKPAESAKPEDGAKVAVGKKPKQALRLQISSTFFVALVTLAILGYLIFTSIQAFQPSAAGDPALAAVATPAIPALKLNQDNERQGPVITVNQGAIGKDNPFAK